MAIKKERSKLLIMTGVSTLFFNLLWWMVPIIFQKDIYIISVIAGVVGTISGVGMILQSNRIVFYFTMATTAVAGIFYLLSPYLEDVIGTIVCLLVLGIAFAKEEAFEVPPAQRYPPPPLMEPSPPRLGEQINFCPNCGVKVPADSRFCPLCGIRLEPYTRST